MKTNPFILAVLLLIQVAAVSSFGQTEEIRSGRIVRGTGTNTSYHSFVIPLDLEKGLVCSNIGGVANSLYPWNATGGTLYHYNATNASSATNLGLRIPFINPIAGFGSRAGGSPLYYGQSYRFGMYSGQVSPNHSVAIILYAFSVTSSNFSLVNAVYVPLPDPANTSEWSAYLTNGYTRTAIVNGLTTVINFDQTYQQWGTTFQGAVTLTHIASPAASNYVFQVELVGVTDKGYTVYDGFGQPAWCRMYTVEFEERPPWRAVFIDQPHFDGEPLPPSYQAKTTDELLTNTPPVTTTFSLPNPPNTYTNLDQSPELRRHPILDQFVSDMRRDPVALARYVHNEIELTDTVSYNDNGSLSEVSVNPPGVARGALATYQEGQGGPAEQCALLVYLLRQAGVPAVYVYPPHNGLKMLDTRLSKLLRIQFKGAVNNLGQTYTTNRLIPVNYPWVAAYVGTNWVHLFPWLKDTSIEEGFNLYDYTGSTYRNGFQWVKDYLYGATNIMSLAAGDDTAGVLFPRFVQNSLAANAPGLSLDDMGVQFVNRKRSYARWQDFPTPFATPTNGVALDSLSSSAITNVFPVMTNIFDLFQVEVRSVANPGKLVSSDLVRMVDIHNRRFLIRHEKTGANAHNLILSLAPFRPGATGLTNFTFGDSLLNSQYKSVALNSTDDQLKVTLVQFRHRMLPINYSTNPPSPNVTYPGIYARTAIADERPLRKGDLAAVCVNAGRVSRAMLNVHAQDLWNMERTLQITPSATNTISPDLYQGGVAYLSGMAYYENISRTEQLLQRLHKSQIISHYAHGLSKLSAKRVAGALPNAGDIILTQPNIDMSFQQSAIAFNGSIHSESGDEQFTALLSLRALWLAHGSSEEHQILNSFYKDSDSVSTVKLLQLAQSQATPTKPGIFALNYLNYVQMGNSNISGTLLKNYDAALWTQATNWLNRYDARANQVFMTPGTVTNKSNSYKGLGALLWSPSGDESAVISGNLNGAYGPFMPDATYSAGNTPNYSLGIDPQGNFFWDSSAPSAGNRILAPDQYAGYNSSDVANNASSGFFNFTPNQDFWTGDTSDMLGLSSQGSQNLNFSQSVQAANGNNGFMGWLSDALSQAGSAVVDPVHAVTGEFYINATDLMLPGPMPLTISRNYSSHNLADNQFGYGWKLNYMPYLSLDSNSNVIFAAEADGSVLAYEKTPTNANIYLPTAAKNPQLNNNTTAGIGSVANRLRNRIEKQVSGPDTFYHLYPPSGGKRTFKVMTFNGGGINRTRPYLTLWEDSRGNAFTFEYGVDSTQADYAEVRRIQSSNGNYLGFIYDVYGHIIEAYSGDGRRLRYEYDRYGDLVKVTSPDASEIEYEYEHRTQNVTNGAVVTTNLFSTHLILKENKPDGRTIRNEYDQHRRVTNQWAAVGADLNLVRNATFIYSNNFNLTNSFTNTITGFTLIKDVFNRTNRYDYTNGLITKITDALNQTVTQDWYEASETNKVGYYARSLESRTDQRGLVTQFKYDANGNVTNSVTSGDLTGDGTTQFATNTVVYNANNLPTLATDPAGNKVQSLYHSQFQFLPESIVRLSGSTQVSSNRMIYFSVTNTFVSGGVTYTNMALGLLQREIRAAGSSDAATNDWAYDGRGFVTASVRYTSTSDPAVTNSFFYNDRNQLAEQTDAAGRKTALDYDAIGRPILKEVFEAGQSTPLAWEYFYYNPNGELTWSDGPRFNPEDYVWRDYDGAGRLITEIRWRSQVNDDATGVQAPAGDALYATTFRQYDAFGNLTRTVDPRGAFSTNGWDAAGRLTQRSSFDMNGALLAREGFAYEPGGQVRFHTNALNGVTETQYTTNGLPKFRRNADGSTNAWRYYVDGRIRREIQGNGAYWETTYDDPNHKSTRIFYSASGSPQATNVSILDRRGNLVQTVDAGGNVFVNFFDGLDRLRIAAGPPIISVQEDCGLSIGCGVFVTNILQHVVTNFYDAAGVTYTTINALGEKTITFFDALGRTTRTEIRDKTGALVRETTTAYAQNHHSVTVTNGSGASAIASTTYTDNDGRTLLAITHPSGSLREYTAREYDLAGNLDFESRNSSASGVITAWSAAAYLYDGLNRVTAKSDRDGAVTYFNYNPMGNLTNRIMPGGLQWNATYNNAGQITKDWNIGGGGAGTRTNTYAYYSAVNPFAGLLQTRADSRGVTCTYTYDDWLRQATNTHTGSLSEQNLTTVLQYEPRGFITSIAEQFASSTTGPATAVQRSFDSYGQLSSETVVVGGGTLYSAGQGFDAAGRRTALGLGNGYGFGWRADGLMASASLNGLGGASYAYNTAGLLTERLVDGRQTTINSRDGAGRPLTVTTKINTITKLTETLAWTGDGLVNTHSLVREDFTDSRSYSYGNLTRRLTEERLNLDATRRWTNIYTFDNGAAAGPGVLTKIGQNASQSAWAGVTDAFSRVNRETNSAVRQIAYGKLNGQATVIASLDNVPQPVTIVGSSEALWPYQWRTTMELTPGTHQLTVTALHPSGLFTTNKTSSFTNNIGSLTITNISDGAGNLTQRIWRKANGTTNLIQTLAWDARGRLHKVTERDSTQSGRDFSVVYDALGRRLRTTEIVVTNNVALTNSPNVVSHYFDPMVEFLEVGVTENGKTTWKLIGPDFDGRYGGQNGTGGFEATASGFAFSPVISDSFGNILAVYEQTGLTWNGSRHAAYGGVPGYRPQAVGSSSGSLANKYSWRNRAADTIGFVWMGGNWLDPQSGRFLAFDPLGHDASDNGYSFCRGNPLGAWDADGRQGFLTANPTSEDYARREAAEAEMYFRMMNPPPSAEDQRFMNRYTAAWGLMGSVIETGIGVFASSAWVGVPVAMHGADHLSANAQQLWTGEPQQSLTHQAIAGTASYLGASDQAAQYWGAGVDITTSFASGFAAGGGSLSFRTGSQAEQFLAQQIGGQGQVRVMTSQGTRIIDQVAGTIANESKVGFQGYSSRIVTQIEKDSDILQNSIRGVDRYDWHFFESAITGQAGADARVLDLLAQNGINYSIYSGGSSLSPVLGTASMFGAASSGVILSKH